LRSMQSTSAKAILRRVLAHTPVRHGDRASNTYLRLRDLIVRGELAPGARVAEGAQALRLGVSRTPVREALERLSREGFLVAATAGRRTELQVALLDPSEVAELWSLIGATESIAIHKIGEMTRYQRHALAAELAEVNDLLAVATARRPLDIGEASSLMAEFHRVVMRSCGGRHLTAVHESIHPHIQRYDWAYGRARGADYRASVREHREIIEAVARADVKKAQRLLEAHWQAGLDRTVKHV
jgi:DNA-binding GntR family transcriptional regulator